MPGRKNIGWIGLLLPPWFLTVYLLLAARHPGYSHLTKAISELGSLDAPDRWLWNVFGYILPGLGIALLGLGLGRELARSRRAWLPALALVACGLAMAVSGVFPGDFEHRDAFTMRMHMVASIGSYLGFLLAGPGFALQFRRRSDWRWLAWPSLAMVLASVAAGFARSGSAPGLGQRLGFACVFLWVALAGLGLLRATGRAPATASDR